MANDQPPVNGTTAADPADIRFQQDLLTRKGDDLRRAIDAYFAAQLAPVARGAWQSIDVATKAVQENLPIFGGSVAATIRDARQALVDSVPNAKAIGNAPSNLEPTAQATGADPIELASGQLVYEHTDLVLDGGGIEFKFVRTYRSRARYPNGPLGVCWDHNYNVWLREISPTVIAVGSGTLREDRYHQASPGPPDVDYYAPDAGQHSIILLNQQTLKFELHSPTGVVWQFTDLGQFDPADAGLHRLERIFDRFQERNPISGEPQPPGNYLHFHYDANKTHLLSSIEVNHPSREVLLEYDDLGRIILLTDYSGRQVGYTFDDYDDLVAVTLPATNDRRLGRTTFYQYTSETGPSQHLLASVLDADGRRYLEVEYGTAEGFADYERVVRQRDDEGVWLLSYADLLPAPDPTSPPDPDEPSAYTVVTQPNGHQVEYWFNAAGAMLFKADAYRDGEGARQRALWRFQVNPDGQAIASLSPEGVFVQHYYARDQYMLQNGAQVSESLDKVPIPPADVRLTFGNLLGTIRRKQPPFPLLAWPSKAIANNIGLVGADDIVQRFTYYEAQLPATVSDPRATTDLDNAQVGRLTTYQYSKDSHRFPLSVTYSVTTRPDGSLQGPAQQLINADLNGRVADLTDPEGHVTHTDYFKDGDHAGPDPTFGSALVVQPMPLSLEGLIRSITRGSGEADQARTDFVINRRGGRTQTTDPRLNTMSMRLDSTDQPIEVARNLVPGVQYTTEFNYTGQGRIQRRTRALETDLGTPVLFNGAPLGPEVETYRYSDTEQLLRRRIGDLDTRTWLTTRHTYNTDGLPSRHFTPAGSITQIRYDRRRLPLTTEEGWGTPEVIASRIFYDPDGRKTATRDGRGNVTRFVYDGFGRLAQTIQVVDRPVGAVDPRPLLQRRGHTTMLQYDKLDNVVLERFFQWEPGDTYVLLSRTRYEFDERNRKIKEVRDWFDGPVPAGPAGLDAFANAPPVGSTPIERWFFRDRNGRLIEERQGVVVAGPNASLGSARLIKYDHAGREIRSSILLPDEGNIEITRTETSYDGNGNPVRIDRYDHEYSPAGVLLNTEVISQAQEFDSLNRHVVSIDGLGNRTEFHYDSRDLLTEQIDPLGNTTSFDYDLYGRKALVREPPDAASTIITSFAFDPDGQVVAVTRGDQANPDIVTHQYEFNAIHKKVTEILAAAVNPRITRWFYDAAGNLATRTLPNKLRLVMGYDAQNRLRQVDVNATQVAMPNPPVLGASLEQFEYDGLGRMVRASTDHGLTAVDMTYDSLGRATAEIQSLFGRPALTLRRTFDPLGNRASLDYPSGRRLQFTHDRASRLRSLDDIARGVPNVGLPGAGVRMITQSEYVGLRKRMERFANGTSTRHDYDAAGRRIGLEHRDAANNTSLGLVSLFDGAGNNRQAWQLGTTALTPARTYGYDNVHRLKYWGDSAIAAPVLAQFSPPGVPAVVLGGQNAIDALIGGQVGVDRDYVYDAGSNRIAETITGSVTAVDVLDRLMAPTYDDNGNPFLEGVRNFGFDSHERLVSVVGGGAAFTATYDGLGRRVLVIENGTSSRFAFDGVSEIAEYQAGNLISESVITEPPDGRIQLSAANEEFILFRDPVGSIRLVTTSAGMVAARGEYDPYGVTLPGTLFLPLLRQGFMGREWDANLSLYHFRARHYDPSQGRFLQLDPLSAEPARSAYQAFASNPLVFSDPYGTNPSPNHMGDAKTDSWIHDAWEWFNNDKWPPFGGVSWLYDPPNDRPIEIDTHKRIGPADPSHRVMQASELYDDWTPSWKWESPHGKPLDWDVQLFVGALPTLLGPLIPETPLIIVQQELGIDAQLVADLKTGIAADYQSVDAFVDIYTRERFMVANSGSHLSVAQSNLAEKLGYTPLGYRVAGPYKEDAEVIMQRFARLSEPPLGPVAFEVSRPICKNCQLQIDWDQFMSNTSRK
jgi:RHS repeat-associated protein